MRALLNRLDKILSGQYPALLLSLVSLAFSYIGYNQSIEAIKPLPQLLEKEVVVCDDNYLGFDNSLVWVRLYATNQGGKPTTLLHVEPDSTFNDWIVGADSNDLGHRITESYRLFYHDAKIRNFQELRCAVDSLRPLDKDDKIEMNAQLEPGAVFPFDIGIQYFPQSNVKFAYYQMKIVGVFSDGSRVPLIASFRW